MNDDRTKGETGKTGCVLWSRPDGVDLGEVWRTGNYFW